MIKFIYQTITACFMLFAASQLEPLFYPVVMNFTVTDAVPEKGAYALKGYMNKVRDCEFVAVSVEDQDKMKLPIKFLDNLRDDAENRPTGSQPFGPWVVRLRPESYQITIESTHICHPMWHTTTVLGTINVYTHK